MALLTFRVYKMKPHYILLITSLSLLTACGETNVLTKKEIAIQSKADAYVSGVLFDNDMSERASYKVKQDGTVVIKFEESVSPKQYTNVVNLLRSNKAIDTVYAEQSGNAVCQ